MVRQPGPFREPADGWSLDELDLLDWMERTGVKPGEDMGAFFSQEA